MVQDFSALPWGQSGMHSVETILGILNLDPGPAIRGPILSHNAGQGSEPQGRLTQLQPLCTHTPFCFPLSINYMRYALSYYKINFMLDGFGQLYANVSVLSMFMVG